MQNHRALFKLIVKLNDLSSIDGVEFVLNYTDRESSEVDKNKLLEFVKKASLNYDEMINHYEYFLNEVNGIFINLKEIIVVYKKLSLRINFNFDLNIPDCSIEQVRFFESTLLIKFKNRKNVDMIKQADIYISPIVINSSDIDDLVKLLSLNEFKTRDDLFNF